MSRQPRLPHGPSKSRPGSTYSCRCYSRGRGCFVGTFLFLDAAGYLPRCSIHFIHALLDSTVQFPVCCNHLPHLLSRLLYLFLEGGPDLLSLRGGNLEEGSLLRQMGCCATKELVRCITALASSSLPWDCK